MNTSTDQTKLFSLNFHAFFCLPQTRMEQSPYKLSYPLVRYVILHRTVHCTVQYTALYVTLHCTLHCTVRYTALYVTLYCTLVSRFLLYSTLLYSTLLYSTPHYHTVLFVLLSDQLSSHMHRSSEEMTSTCAWSRTHTLYLHRASTSPSLVLP